MAVLDAILIKLMKSTLMKQGIFLINLPLTSP